jgi:hypothetical protein
LIPQLSRRAIYPESLRGRSLLALLVPMKSEEMCQHLSDGKLWRYLERCDAHLAEDCRAAGCQHCGGTLHQANYTRKPRGIGVNREMWRHSFCCAEEGCRKRHNPPSLRFLGRKVYLGMVVILLSAMRHGLSPRRMEMLRAKLSIDRRTLERWRRWWQEDFVRSDFWKVSRIRFMPVLCEATMPLPLCEAFQAERRDRLLNLLGFLSTIGDPMRFFDARVLPAEDAQ